MHTQATIVPVSKCVFNAISSVCDAFIQATLEKTIAQQYLVHGGPNGGREAQEAQGVAGGRGVEHNHVVVHGLHLMTTIRCERILGGLLLKCQQRGTQAPGVNSRVQ